MSANRLNAGNTDTEESEDEPNGPQLWGCFICAFQTYEEPAADVDGVRWCGCGGTFMSGTAYRDYIRECWWEGANDLARRVRDAGRRVEDRLRAGDAVGLREAFGTLHQELDYGFAPYPKTLDDVNFERMNARRAWNRRSSGR